MTLLLLPREAESQPQWRFGRRLTRGDRIEFVEFEVGDYTIEAATHSVTRLKCMIRKPKVIVSIDDMNAVFALKA